MKSPERISKLLTHAEYIKTSESAFAVDVYDDFVMSTFVITEEELEATYPDMSDLIRLLLKRKGKPLYISGAEALLNYRLLKKPIVFETKFGTAVYADTIKSISIAQNAIQAVGDFYQVKRYKNRESEKNIIKAVENKPLHRSLSVNLAYMEKQFPNFETMLITYSALDMPICDMAEQLFKVGNNEATTCVSLPNDVEFG